MKILHVTSECSPLLSTGGLAEVSASLPKALIEYGHEVRLAMPFYQSIDRKYAGISIATPIATMPTAKYNVPRNRFIERRKLKMPPGGDAIQIGN